MLCRVVLVATQMYVKYGDKKRKVSNKLLNKFQYGTNKNVELQTQTDIFLTNMLHTVPSGEESRRMDVK